MVGCRWCARQRPKSLARWTSQAAMYAQAPACRYSCSMRVQRSGAGGREGWIRMRSWMLVFSSADEHKVAAAQRRASPATLVEVKHPTGLGGEVGVAWKNPASVAPRAQRLAAEPAPQSGAAHLGHDTFGDDLTLNIGERPARQRQTAAVRQFARQRLNRDDDAGGKSGRVPRREVPLRGRGSHVHRSACAICLRFLARHIQARPDDVVGQTLCGHEYDLSPHHISIR